MEIQFETRIEHFGDMGEKTGWRYVTIPASLANELNPGVKKSYRVKGYLDRLAIKAVALIPMGQGDFIIPLNVGLRKQLRKEAGASIHLQLELDTDEFQLDPDFADCLAEAPDEKAYFDTLTPSHQRYFSKWISEAKTTQTKERRIVDCLRAFSLRWDYGQMIRNRKKI